MDESRGRSPTQPAFVVVLNNDSMSPRYRAGAHLRVDPRKSVAIGDDVCATADVEGHLVIGVLISRNGASITLRGYGQPSEIELPRAALLGRISPAGDLLL